MALLPSRWGWDRWFDNFLTDPFYWPSDLSPWGRTETGATGFRNPLTDMVETDGEITISSELPGINKDDIEITADENAVTIRVEKEESKEEGGKKKGYHRIERSYRGFYRHIPLPGQIDPAQIQAEYKNGVLTLHIPKIEIEKHEMKKIKIQ
jgi:HSP20 family protein